MQAQELRIGNYVDYFGKITQIDGIKRCSDGSFAVEICEKRPSGCSWCEYAPIETPSLKPIPLTEEWLLNFGFELEADEGDIKYFMNNRINRNYGVKLYDNEELYIYHEYPMSCEYTILQEINHVHQLQNLYWCLCGEELTLKTEQ